MTRVVFSEPDAGGVGGRARFGGGEGSGGVSSSMVAFSPLGLLGLEGVCAPWRLRRFIDAERGRGAYDLPPSLTMSLDGFEGDLVLVMGICSATSITGLSETLTAPLALEVAGETGEYSAVQPRLVLASRDDTGETGTRVLCVTFLKLASLEREDDAARGARGAGRSAGIWICGLTLRRR